MNINLFNIKTISNLVARKDDFRAGDLAWHEGTLVSFGEAVKVSLVIDDEDSVYTDSRLMRLWTPLGVPCDHDAVKDVMKNFSERNAPQMEFYTGEDIVVLTPYPTECRVGESVFILY